ncbi:MAG: cyclic-di-AMP receptor [Clostridiales bacterium]|nr:cyclic-di-AMP receptor [Clostridiales bacterium]
MDETQHSYRLILAILQNDDYEDTVEELNENGIFVTKLSSSGGFLKKDNVTIMIGVEKDRLADVMELLKKNAGKRKQTYYALPTPVNGEHYMGPGLPVPIERETGGVTVFTLAMDEIKKM